MRLFGQITRRSVGGVTLAQCAALMPPIWVVALTEPERHGILLVVALISALLWEAIFGVLRHHGPSAHGVTTALIVAVLVPADTAVWQLALVVSLGVVLGELVFGGRGFGFVHPATVALSLLVISFPEIQLPPSSQGLAIATLPGAVLLLALGLISWRVILAVVVAAWIGFGAAGSLAEFASMAIPLAFGIIFLVCDPTSATATNLGRWIYGALAGALCVVFSSGGAATAEAVVFSALMASVFASLIDHLVILDHARRRAGRHA